jgi:hypothetical protein
MGSMTLSDISTKRGSARAAFCRSGASAGWLFNRILKAVRTPDERLGDLDARWPPTRRQRRVRA